MYLRLKSGLVVFAEVLVVVAVVVVDPKKESNKIFTNSLLLVHY